MGDSHMQAAPSVTSLQNGAPPHPSRSGSPVSQRSGTSALVALLIYNTQGSL